MSTADIAGVLVLGGIAVWGALLNFRLQRQAKRAIAESIDRNKLCVRAIERQWFGMGPFEGRHLNKAIFRVPIIDEVEAPQVFWWRFEFDLFGNIIDRETKREHAN